MLFRMFLLLLVLVFAPFQIALSVPQNPIVFVSQVPQPADFATIGSTFANHRGSVQVAPRGGDLWIRYPDGTLKNLTASAGFGVNGYQNSQAIAVRDPSVHWDGTKVIFSMVFGSPELYETTEYFWQIYEVSKLGKNETPQITKLPFQPTNYNNIMPIYGSDDAVIYVSDRPYNGQHHLYPALDEYESTPTNTGLWKLNLNNGTIELLDHAPSGAFNPIIDSFGRIIYTRWDHLQQDQQADTDQYGAYNFISEAVSSGSLNNRIEVFPEPHGVQRQVNPFLNLFKMNHFFPWQVFQDGSGLETLNHIGRHELHEFFGRNFNDDQNLEDFISVNSGRSNNKPISSMFQLREDPASPGTFYGVNAQEFRTHSAGQIVTISGAPTIKTDDMVVNYVTHPDTFIDYLPPGPNHSGFYRNPLPLSEGGIIATHTSQTGADMNTGTRAAPRALYDFRLKTLRRVGDYWVADQALTNGISKTVSYYDPDVLVTYSGPLWEWQPVELVARARPAASNSSIPKIEKDVFLSEEVELQTFVDYLKSENLALIVSRDLTTRDAHDRQQPYSLKVAGSSTSTLAAQGKVYEVGSMQILQADLVRAYTRASKGRRAIAQALHEAPESPMAGIYPGSVNVAPDGSLAAIVPAKKALSWQLLDPNGESIVRERYWVGLASGEIRVCTSCHGINTTDQLGRSTPQNTPEALRVLLKWWKEKRNSPDIKRPPPDEGIAPVSLRMRALGVKRQGMPAVRGRLFSKRQAIVRVEGLHAPNVPKKKLSLKLRVNGQACSKSIGVVQGGVTSIQELKKAMPATFGRFNLTFQLVMGKKVYASSKATLVGNNFRLQNSSAIRVAASVEAVCRQVRKFR